MLVLSVRQPWAFAICAGIQDVFNIRHLPPIDMACPTTLLICARKEPVPQYFDHKLDDRNITIKNEKLMGNIPPYEELPYNTIIGYVECTGVTQDSESFWAEQIEYEWENPIYKLSFQRPRFFNVPIPVRHEVYGPFFRVAIDKTSLLNSYEVTLKKPLIDGTCLKMPVSKALLQEIEGGEKTVSYDLCDTNENYFFNPVTRESYPLESIDFYHNDKFIHKEIESVQIGHYVDDNNMPVHFPGYKESDDTICEIIIINLKS